MWCWLHEHGLCLRWLGPGLCSASVGFAAVPPAADYAYGWRIETDRPATFHEILLPIEVYQAVTDEQLRDLGVYSAGGESVPRIVRFQEPEVRSTEQRIPLPILPLHQNVNVRADDIRLSFQRGGDLSTLTLDASQPSDDGPADRVLVAYIVDLTSLEGPLSGLELNWTPTTQPFVGHVEIKASDNLETWRSVGAGSIASLRHEGSSIDRRTVNIIGPKADYLRIEWQDTPDDWFLTRLVGLRRSDVPESVREELVLDPVDQDASDGGHIFDARGSPPVDQVRLGLARDNTVVTATVYFWRPPADSVQRAGDGWQRVGQALFYRLRKGDDTVTNDPLRFREQRASRWKVVLEDGQKDWPLSLALSWRPERVIFMAQGEGPYQLVAGRAADDAMGFPQELKFRGAEIVQLFGDPDNTSVASLGARYELGGEAQRLALSSPPWTQWILWLALCATVAVAAFMALRLMRQTRAD
jgi:hypothetical protein